jgi:rod shape determining protein RodA
MYSFGDSNAFFERQSIWLAVSVCACLVASLIDYRFLRRTNVVMVLFGIMVFGLMALFAFAAVTKGAQSWFDLGVFAVQPADPAKLVLIIVLAKYFARRHVEIARPQHLLVSLVYAGLLAVPVLFQPDLGSAVILGAIWFGMILAAGITRKHFLVLVTVGVLAAVGMWFFGLQPYQQERIRTFLDPLSDIQGSGYNAYQSTIAVGSGGLWGKGVGLGTQSKLQFLPEYETDFIFAAFAEEWGFVGVVFLCVLFGIVLWRILLHAIRGPTNFETLFGVGLAVMFLSHFLIHVGINIGLLPVTGTTIPFMSYGGSHLFTEFVGLGILMGMSRYEKAAHREALEREVVGVV